MPGASPTIMPAVQEEIDYMEYKLQDETSQLGCVQSVKQPAVLELSTNVSAIPRIAAPSARTVLVPSIDKALPFTPAPSYSPSSYGSSPASQTTTPGCPPHLFSPSTPPASGIAKSYTALTTDRNPHRRRRKSRGPTYLPLDAYPAGPISNVSPAFATGYPTPSGNTTYLPLSTPPSSTPSLDPSPSTSPRSTSPATPPSHPATRRSSLAPTNSRPAEQGAHLMSPTYLSHHALQSQVCSPFSPNAAFSPVPLSAISIGRPTTYQQAQHAQSFTPEQEAAQQALEADEARKGSIGGLLAAAAASLSLSPRDEDDLGRGRQGPSLGGILSSPGSVSSWSTTSSGNGGWGITSAGPILPGGGSSSSRASSRKSSFGDLSAPLVQNGGHGAVVSQVGPEGWGGLNGIVSGMAKGMGSLEGEVWRWARGKPASRGGILG